MFIRHWFDCLVETQNHSTLSLAGIACSFRVTEENLLFETDLSGPPSFFSLFQLLLEELILIFHYIQFIIYFCSLGTEAILCSTCTHYPCFELNKKNFVSIIFI